MVINDTPDNAMGSSWVGGMAGGSRFEDWDLLPNSVDLLEAGPSTRVPSPIFDSYCYLAKAMFSLSNNLIERLSDEQKHQEASEILEDLLSRVSRRVLLNLLENDIPTVRAAWEASLRFVYMTRRNGAFEILIEVGARHHQ